ncbi:alpha/beta hydrolase [Paenibacillus sacheonensis]|uniref:Alpha/beta hydrolase fold domain-containing protein n=1 Tax=Paenibacillus sacheonensis TaxID=742054 RepID=A0A7X5C3T4_9BACL|nr:alpha/beta hydrolase [Paenibacillus sacheonensis]MBM7568967.1 acetyl esterase [Paenibacillus sacheonensis]NBC72660.1 alpha/beta hydrolase fold domain-containing protein [Paenibacillus sacheonensis]
MQSKTSTSKVVLEQEAQQFVEKTSKPPFLYELGPEKGREQVNKVQSGPVTKPAARLAIRSVPGGPKGEVPVTIVTPKEITGTPGLIVYIHGAGWVFGNAHTHDRLVRELAVGSGSIVVFPEYSLSPENKYPTAIEEIYAVVKWAAENGEELGADVSRLTVAGDSVGGNMTAAVTLMAKERGGPRIAKQLLFYPVTDAAFDTESYEQFAEGYFLSREGMQWFWDQYAADPKERAEVTASPLRASKEQLKDLPPALIITGEADVLRDEGEAYAAKLREAGVRVTAARFQGIIHDFVMLNDLSDTAAARGALLLANAWLREDQTRGNR